jgi:pantoate--beta-alanine ligase
MVADLNLNVKVIGCPIVREADGLALSSRNTYLDPKQRQAALILYRTLDEAGRLIAAGERDAQSLQRRLLQFLATEPSATLDYLEIVSSDTLQPLIRLQGAVLIALAVKIGATRLIDNRVYQLSAGGDDEDVAPNV